MGMGEDVQRYLEQTRRAKELLGQFVSGGEQGVFHEVYVVGKVVDWHPKSHGGLHMGYVILPMDNPLGPKASNVGVRPAEAVSFSDIGGVKPCQFDIVHVQRSGGWASPRISIEIVR